MPRTTPTLPAARPTTRMSQSGTTANLSGDGAEGRPSPLVWTYLGYVGYYVGAALISGGVVHYPMARARYALIIAVGAALFLVATLFNEFVLTRRRPPRSELVRVVCSSLVLSFGLGMLSGGVQHFSDVPERAATLIPLGVVLSFAGFLARYQPQRRRAVIGPVGVAIAVTAGILFFALHDVAAGMGPSEHGHGETPASTPHVEPGSSVPSGQPWPSQPADGHGHSH